MPVPGTYTTFTNLNRFVNLSVNRVSDVIFIATSNTRPIASRGRIPTGGKDSIDFSPVTMAAPSNTKPVGGKDTLMIKHEPVRATLKHAVHTKSITNLGDEPVTPRRSIQAKTTVKFDGWLNAASPDAKRVRKAAASPDRTTCKSVLRHDLWTASYIDSPRKVGKVGPSPGGLDSLVLA